MSTPSRRRITDVSQRIAVDLMHLAAGRPDLSTNPADHDPGCLRTINPSERCSCSRRRDSAERDLLH